MTKNERFVSLSSQNRVIQRLVGEEEECLGGAEGEIMWEFQGIGRSGCLTRSSVLVIGAEGIRCGHGPYRGLLIAVVSDRAAGAHWLAAAGTR